MRSIHVILAVAGLIAVGVGGAIYLQSSQSADAAPAAKPFRPKGKMFIVENDTNTQLFIDADTVRGDRQRRQGWVISDHSRDKTMENGERKELFVVNCDTTGFRIVSVVAYKRDGSIRGDWNEGRTPAQTEYPVPGSIGEEITNALCDSRYDAPLNKV